MPSTCQWYREMCLVCLHSCGGWSVRKCYVGYIFFESNQGLSQKGVPTVALFSRESGKLRGCGDGRALRRWVFR